MQLSIELILKFLFGLCLGSFVNVVTYRLPRKISISYPRSFCPKCRKPIKIIDNIPVLSWIRLRGKCSNCNKQISYKYILIEISFAILFTICTYSYTFLNNNFLNIVFSLSTSIFLIIFVSITLIDIDYLVIPSSLSLSGIIFGLLFSILNSIVYEIDNPNSLIINHFYATCLGFIIFEFIRFFGKKIFKKPALGKGDSFLAACLGSWLGIQWLILSSILSIYYAGIFSCIGIIIKKIKPGNLIPFAPFMALGGISVWIMGYEFWNKILFYSIS